MTDTHVLIAGVGYLGLTLARHIADETGDRIIVVARRRSLRRKLIVRQLQDTGAEIVADNTISADLIPKGDYYYYLAGKPGGRYKDVWEAHVGVLERILSKLSGSTLVYISSIAVTADLSPSPPGSVVYEEEEHLKGRGRFETYHSETKAMGERLVRDKHNGSWTILRPGLIYGGLNPHIEWRLIRMLCRLRLAPYSPFAPAVSVSNVARIAFEAATRGHLEGRWVNLVEEEGMEKAVRYECPKGRLVDTTAFLSIGKIMSRGSPLRLAWSIVSKRYVYRSRHVSL